MPDYPRHSFETDGDICRCDYKGYTDGLHIVDGTTVGELRKLTPGMQIHPAVPDVATYSKRHSDARKCIVFHWRVSTLIIEEEDDA